MLPFEPCMMFESKNTTEPVRPFGATMPNSAASCERLSSSGVPTSCCWSEER
jgi:hypothetical protein